MCNYITSLHTGKFWMGKIKNAEVQFDKGKNKQEELRLKKTDTIL